MSSSRGFASCEGWERGLRPSKCEKIYLFENSFSTTPYKKRKILSGLFGRAIHTNPQHKQPLGMTFFIFLLAKTQLLPCLRGGGRRPEGSVGFVGY